MPTNHDVSVLCTRLCTCICSHAKLDATSRLSSSNTDVAAASKSEYYLSRHSSPGMELSTLQIPILLSLSLYRYFTTGRLDAHIFLGIYFLLSYVFPFAKNSLIAYRTGLPRVHIFWQPHSFVWMVAGVPLRPLLQRHLPTWLWNRLAITIYGWEFQEGLAPFAKFAAPQGDKKSFWLVSCGDELELWTWDKEIVKQVLTRHHDFHQLKLTALFLEKFGKSLFTSNGESWAKQRKIMASVVNERISKNVFGETVRQAEGLVGELMNNEKKEKGVAETNKIFDMMKKVTIHVLSGAGMGTTVSWEGDEAGGEKKQLKPGMKMNYMDACKIVTAATMGPIILPQWFTSNYPSWLPGHEYMRNLSVAMREFPVHTGDLLDTERERQRQNNMSDTGRGNAMSALLQHAKTDQNPSGLTEEEIRGNLFIFTVAGFETTANTLSYSIMFLIRYPEWQDWLFQEIDSLLPASGADDEELDYVSLFPKCQRILAFMFETLRFHPPLVHIVKETQGGDHILTNEAGKEVKFPQGSLVYLHVVALHLDPEIYRNVNIDTSHGEKEDDHDETRFRPTRWLNQPSSGQKSTHFSPPKGTFLPWSMGPRNCPGQKMSQVEFVAIMLVLLRRHSIEVVKLEGEGEKEAQERIEKWVRNSFSKATLEMSGVYDIKGEEGGFKVGLRKRR